MGFVTRAAILVITAATTGSAAQTQQNSPAYLCSEDSQGKVIVVALAHPVYPPVARLANVTGDVELKLTVRRDGSVESASVASGPPMLQQAALNSAQQSRFECRGCAQELTSQSFIYSFQLIASPDYPCPESSGLRVSHSDDRITVIAEPPLVDPYFSYIRTRSAKCIYLWSCGTRWGGEDYYFERVRSPKCLDLWNCGQRLREPFATCKEQQRKLAY